MLIDAFEQQRPRLHAVAYRMLGSHADADDVVQEAWLRLSRQDEAAIDNLGGWLTTVVGRLSLDALRARRAPVVTFDADRPGPEDDAVLADAVGIALLAVLESLRPDERLAFVLHDLFAVPFEEIGAILGRSTDAAKMLASRSRRKVQVDRDRPAAHREVVDAFLAASRHGDFEALLRVLDPEVRLAVDTADGVVVTLGATKVAASARLGAAAAGYVRAALVDGKPGVIGWHRDGRPLSVLAFTVVGGRITAITGLADEARLSGLGLPDPC